MLCDSFTSQMCRAWFSSSRLHTVINESVVVKQIELDHCSETSGHWRIIPCIIWVPCVTIRYTGMLYIFKDLQPPELSLQSPLQHIRNTLRCKVTEGGSDPATSSLNNRKLCLLEFLIKPQCLLTLSESTEERFNLTETERRASSCWVFFFKDFSVFFFFFLKLIVKIKEV